MVDLNYINSNITYFKDSESVFGNILLYYRDGFESKVISIPWTRKILPRFLPLSWDYYFYNNIQINSSNFKFCFYDIECSDTESIRDFTNKRIVSIAFEDMEGNRFVFCDDDEETILNNTYTFFSQYDMMIGFYSDEFDFPILVSRGLKYGINFMDWYWKEADLYFIFKKFNNISVVLSASKLTSWSLNSLAKEFLGMAKIDIHRDDSSTPVIMNLFNSDRETLKKYNQMDVEITKKLAVKFDIIETLKVMSDETKAPIQSISASMAPAIEFILLSYILNNYKSKAERDEIFKYLEASYYSTPSEYSGANNLISEPGYYKDICVYDFHSMYPSLIRTFNISFETILNLSEYDLNHLSDSIVLNRLISANQGILSRISDSLQAKRDYYKQTGQKTREVSIKLINNSLYGYFGGKNVKFHNTKIASAITFLARDVLNSVFYHFNAVYGDTDSIFVNVPVDEVESVKDKINGFIRDKYKLSDRFYLEMAVDKYFKKLILISKKKYIGLKLDGSIGGKGSELVRSDFTVYGKEMMTELVEKILLEGQTKSQIFRYLKTKRSEILSGKVSADKLILFQTLTKLPDEYRVKLPHVSVAEQMMKNKEQVYLGMKIRYLIVKNDSSSRITAISADDEKNYKNIDYSYYWSNKLFPAIERILRVVYQVTDSEINLLASTKNLGDQKQLIY